ncbi:MAG: glycosyltransferase [Advenella sp.]|nr:glycosyltransferase [Advenella sp.]
MKIAKILTGDPSNQKGAFNNIMERIKNLKFLEKNVDCYMIRIEYSWLLKLIKFNFTKTKKEDFCIINEIRFNNLWITMGLIDYFLTHRLHKKVSIAQKQLKKHSRLFSKYDLLSVHGYEAVIISINAKKKFNVPFVATWHGSDINFVPFHNIEIQKKIKDLLENASHNFFVSKDLLLTSNKVSTKKNKSVLYTGPANYFIKYPEEKKINLKRKYKINQKYIIGFIGNFISVKNVLILPEIFSQLKKNINDIAFILVGDGNQEKKLREKINLLLIDNVYFFGRCEPQEIPNILNCMDVLLLPSINEGLPRVTLEAQACGVHVVGSNRGGIPEAIGNNNSFELDSSFVTKITQRVVDILQDSNIKPELPKKFSWKHALEHEKKIHIETINTKTI